MDTHCCSWSNSFRGCAQCTRTRPEWRVRVEMALWLSPLPCPIVGRWSWPPHSDVVRQSRRPPQIREPLPIEVTNHVLAVLFALDEKISLKNVRIARRGAAAGPSGMTTEHLRVPLESRRCQSLFVKLAEKLAQADVPDTIIPVIRRGRMTALRKGDGGVRGIVVGDVMSLGPTPHLPTLGGQKTTPPVRPTFQPCWHDAPNCLHDGVSFVSPLLLVDRKLLAAINSAHWPCAKRLTNFSLEINPPLPLGGL